MGLRVVGVIVLGQMFGLGIAGVWLSILIDLLLRAIFLTWRFHVKQENWLNRPFFWGYKQVVLEVDYGLPYFMLVILSQFLL